MAARPPSAQLRPEKAKEQSVGLLPPTAVSGPLRLTPDLPTNARYPLCPPEQTTTLPVQRNRRVKAAVQVKTSRITLYLLSLTVVFGCVLPYFGETYLPLIAERNLPLPDEPDEPLPFANLTTSFPGVSERMYVLIVSSRTGWARVAVAGLRLRRGRPCSPPPRQAA